MLNVEDSVGGAQPWHQRMGQWLCAACQDFQPPTHPLYTTEGGSVISGTVRARSCLNSPCLVTLRPTRYLRSYARYSQRFRRIHRCFAGVSRAFRGRFAGVSPNSQAYKSIRTTLEPFTLSQRFRKIRTRFARFTLVSHLISQEIHADSQPFRTVSRRFAALTRCESV